MNRILLMLPLLIVAALAIAQPSSQVTVVGAVTPGHCTGFSSTLQLQDTGSVCGTSGVLQSGGFNSISLNGSATGISPAVATQGGDTNIGLTFNTKGSGSYVFDDNAFGNTLFQINGSTTSVNFLTVTPGNTGNVVILGAAGSDPSVPIQLNTKGSGSVFLTVGGQNSLVISSAGAHLGTSTGAAPAPTANSCAGFVLSSGTNDNEGRITFTSATTCSVNFGTAFVAAPFCSIMPNSAPSTVQVTTTTGGFAATFGTAQTSLQWICKGT